MITREQERQILERLRESYESAGYQFFIEPTVPMLPAALARYRPDALAVRNDEKLIIEVANPDPSPSTAGNWRLADLAHSIEKLESGWKFVVIRTSASENSEYPVSIVEPATLLDALDEVRELEGSGHHAAALVIGWSVLEAVARKAMAAESTFAPASLTPARAVDFLEQSGELDDRQAAQLRDLAKLRNAVVHGDFSRRVDATAVGMLLECVTSLLPPAAPKAAE